MIQSYHSASKEVFLDPKSQKKNDGDVEQKEQKVTFASPVCFSTNSQNSSSTIQKPLKRRREERMRNLYLDENDFTALKAYEKQSNSKQNQVLEFEEQLTHLKKGQIPFQQKIASGILTPISKKSSTLNPLFNSKTSREPQKLCSQSPLNQKESIQSSLKEKKLARNKYGMVLQHLDSNNLILRPQLNLSEKSINCDENREFLNSFKTQFQENLNSKLSNLNSNQIIEPKNTKQSQCGNPLEQQENAGKYLFITPNKHETMFQVYGSPSKQVFCRSQSSEARYPNSNIQDLISERELDDQEGQYGSDRSKQQSSPFLRNRNDDSLLDDQYLEIPKQKQISEDIARINRQGTQQSRKDMYIPCSFASYNKLNDCGEDFSILQNNINNNNNDQSDVFNGQSQQYKEYDCYQQCSYKSNQNQNFCFPQLQDFDQQLNDYSPFNINSEVACQQQEQQQTYCQNFSQIEIQQFNLNPNYMTEIRGGYQLPFNDQINSNNEQQLQESRFLSINNRNNIMYDQINNINPDIKFGFQIDQSSSNNHKPSMIVLAANQQKYKPASLHQLNSQDSKIENNFSESSSQSDLSSQVLCEEIKSKNDELQQKDEKIPQKNNDHIIQSQIKNKKSQLSTDQNKSTINVIKKTEENYLKVERIVHCKKQQKLQQQLQICEEPKINSKRKGTSQLLDNSIIQKKVKDNNSNLLIKKSVGRSDQTTKSQSSKRKNNIRPDINSLKLNESNLKNKFDTKNLVKNFLNQFLSFVLLQDEQPIILELLALSSSQLKELEEYQDKLKLFFKHKKFNRALLKDFMHIPNYRKVFEYFLKQRANDWILHGRMKDKPSHLRALQNFIYICNNHEEIKSWRFRYNFV